MILTMIIKIIRGLLALALLSPSLARAGNNGFFTTYASDVEEGEAELMLMNDLTLPSHEHRGEGQGLYLSHMMELEYGVSPQIAVELMLEGYEDLRSGEMAFTGFRLEGRWRLFKDEVPLNPMLYVEYEHLSAATRYKMEVSGWVLPPYEEGPEPPNERILESRLVLSQRFGQVTGAFNTIFETDLRSGTTAFGYALGAMWAEGHTHGGGGCPCLSGMPGCTCAHCAGHGGACTCHHQGGWGLGVELFGALGDTRAFGFRPSRQEHYLGPIVLYHLSPRWMVHAQLAAGLTAPSDHLLRVNVGYEI